MAYFLDPELAALATGNYKVRTTSDAPARKMPNKYGKRCDGCGTWVPAKAGYLGKSNGAWVVYCTKCP